MEQRLQWTEIKQQKMMAFLARAMKNPAFIQQLLQQKEKRKELEEAMTKKRRRPIEEGAKGIGESSSGCERSSSVKVETLEYGVSDLEVLAMEMQGFGKVGRGQEALEPQERLDGELDEGFWEELMYSEKFEDQLDIPTAEGEYEDEDVNVLANCSGCLESSH